MKLICHSNQNDSQAIYNYNVLIPDSSSNRHQNQGIEIHGSESFNLSRNLSAIKILQHL